VDFEMLLAGMEKEDDGRVVNERLRLLDTVNERGEQLIHFEGRQEKEMGVKKPECRGK
jgi:hypothetical protein